MANQEIGGPGGLRYGLRLTTFQFSGEEKGTFYFLSCTVGGQLPKSRSDQRLPLSPSISQKVTDGG